MTAVGKPKKGAHNKVDQEDKKDQKALTEGIPSITRSIADAVVIKNENVFFLTKPDGCVPIADNHGFGLYYHDCRYLSGYELKVAGEELNALVSNAESGFASVYELVNPEIEMTDGRHITRDQIGFKWERMIDAGDLTLFDVLTVHNYGRKHEEFPLTFSFRCDFKDIFAIRGLLPVQPGDVRPPEWKDGKLTFRYEGEDGIHRHLSIHFSPRPDSTEGTTAEFNLALSAQEQREILISLMITESEKKEEVRPASKERPDLKNMESYFQKTTKGWVEDQTEITSDSLLLNNVLQRSLQDVRTLRNHLGEGEYFSAGVPWYVALFGRDSLITGLQMLGYNPKIAEQTLRILAKYQGQEVNEYRDEEPGKILHELRVGELARLNKIPHTPYYGTVDATPLFLILLARHAMWTGDLGLFNELRDNVDRALDWMENYGDADGDGYLEYDSKSGQGLINHGWKDSGESIVNADGSLATPPIDLVEVQGYAYLAKKSMADLFERVGERDRSLRLREEAERLYWRFNQDFWLEDMEFYALALQAENNPAAVVSSNPGQAMWGGIVETDKCGKAVKRLMSEDMFNGWGIRTLSANDQCYNPNGYHVGTVWPHDNSLIMDGFRRYGYDEEARQVFQGIVEAAMNFEHYRLPEVFAGFAREDYRVPVKYPVACHPQAWSAGSVPFMLTSLLGLEADAFKKRLNIKRPILPNFVDRLRVRDLKVGSARADINFRRTDDQGKCSVDLAKVEGELNVIHTLDQD